MLDGFTRSQKNKKEARDMIREDVFKWYLANNDYVEPLQQCLDSKSYDSKSLWWLEPLIPNVENPCVIEEEKLDGQWTLRIEPIAQKIRVFT